MIVNTEYHQDTGVMADTFGKDGTRIVGLHGDKPGTPFILDRKASLDLAAQLIRNAVGPVKAAVLAGAIDVGSDGIADFETRQTANALAADLAGVTA